MDRISEHGKRCAALVAGFHAAKTSGIPIGLQKTTSNLFRRREQTARHKLDVLSFDGVLRVDPDRMIADVRVMTTYGALVDETLRYGLLPAVVPIEDHHSPGDHDHWLLGDTRSIFRRGVLN